VEFQNERNYLKFQEQKTRTDFEYRAINYVKKLFSASQEFVYVEYL
jgi:hypothetical protein